MSKVELVCDENDILAMGRLEFVNEPSTRFYQFKLFTKRYACPGKCMCVKKECLMRDSCTGCEMSFIKTLMEDTLISD